MHGHTRMPKRRGMPNDLFLKNDKQLGPNKPGGRILEILYEQVVQVRGLFSILKESSYSNSSFKENVVQVVIVPSLFETKSSLQQQQ